MIAIGPTLVAIAAITSGVVVSNAPYARSHVNSNDPSSQCLWWNAGSVVFYQSAVGNPVNGGTEFAAISSSLQSWRAIQNGCGNLTLSEGLPHLSGTAGRTVGYDQNSSNNYNVVMFRQTLCTSAAPPGDPCFSNNTCNNQYDCWGNNSSTIGLTTTTFRVSSGQILDADIEFNAAVFHFTTWPATGSPCIGCPTCSGGNYSNCVSTDVQNTATHEFGHSQGLDHTTYCGPVDGGIMCSVMNPTSSTGETSKRAIDPWSAGFVCDVYPKGQPSQPCIPLSSQGSGICTNASGLSTPCGSGGCAAVPGSVAWPLIALCIFLIRRQIVRA
jgi:hypothetical protein